MMTMYLYLEFISLPEKNVEIEDYNNYKKLYKEDKEILYQFRY